MYVSSLKKHYRAERTNLVKRASFTDPDSFRGVSPYGVFMPAAEIDTRPKVSTKIVVATKK